MNGRARTVARRGIQGISIQEEGGNTGEGEQDIDIIYSYVQSSTVCTVEAVPGSTCILPATSSRGPVIN
jgi:hypothetical protein